MAGAVATPEHASWAWPLFLATAAGLSTTAGALVAVIRKPSTQVMAGLLGVALGVMATVSILELLIKNAMEMDALLVCAACLAGGLAYYMLEPLFPKMEDHTHASAQAKKAPMQQQPLSPATSVDRILEGRRKAVVSGSAASSSSFTGGHANGITIAEKPPLIAAGVTAGQGRWTADAESRGAPDGGLDAAGEASAMSGLPPDGHGGGGGGSSESRGGGGGGAAGAAGRLSAAKMLRLGLLMAVTMTLHNLPEGFAVAFSALTDFGPIMAIAIAMHNIPEGVIVAAPIYAATGSRWRAVGIATASGLSEPLGALLSLALLQPFFTPERLHYLLAFVGGIMLAVCGIELWPEGRNCRHDRDFGVGIAVGSVVMAWTLYVQG